MTAVDIPITIEQGATFDGTWTIHDGLSASDPLVDFTTATEIRMQIRKRQGLPILAEVKSTGTSPGITHGGPLGTITVHMPPSVTTFITSKQCRYDLEVEWPSGDVDRVAKGIVTVDPNITQAVGEPVVGA